MAKTKTKAKSKLDFDELNSFDIYYAPMQIDIGSKARRKELAEYLTDAFLFFFSAYEVYQSHKLYGILQKDVYEKLLADKITEAVTRVTGIDSYMSDHIRQMSKEVVNTTFEKESKEVKKSDVSENENSSTPSNRTNSPLITPTFEPTPQGASVFPYNTSADAPDHKSEESTESDYWLSYDRAENIAKSEANTFLNYTDYTEAKERGATKKRWLTMLDDKVRQTHSEVEGQTIGIDELFTVGDSLMKFPHDLSESPNPSEVIGCRCAVEYI